MKKIIKLTESELVSLVKRVIKEQSVNLSQSVGVPLATTKTKTFNKNDAEYEKNVKQPEKLIGKRATFYLKKEDAMAAYQAGKSNPESQGSIIAKITSIDAKDNRYALLTLQIEELDTPYVTAKTNTRVTFDRMTGSFTISLPSKTANYFSESVKNILNNEFFSTELASNNKTQQSSNGINANMA